MESEILYWLKPVILQVVGGLVTFVAPTSCWYQRLEVHALAAFLQLELFRVYRKINLIR